MVQPSGLKRFYRYGNYGIDIIAFLKFKQCRHPIITVHMEKQPIPLVRIDVAHQASFVTRLFDGRAIH